MKSKSCPLCKPMREKEITDPDSQEGIDCCLSCELGKCEFDGRKLPSGITLIRKRQARQLCCEGKLSVREIAKLLGTCERTIQRYVK